MKLRRTGPSIHALRKAHQLYKREIVARYATFKDAFRAIDADNSGLIRRAELRKFLSGLNNKTPDRVITGLIDFCDSDGDAKTLDIHEFEAMLTADKLGGPDGYDPQYQKKQKQRTAK